MEADTAGDVYRVSHVVRGKSVDYLRRNCIGARARGFLIPFDPWSRPARHVVSSLTVGRARRSCGEAAISFGEETKRRVGLVVVRESGQTSLTRGITTQSNYAVAALFVRFKQREWIDRRGGLSPSKDGRKRPDVPAHLSAIAPPKGDHKGRPYECGPHATLSF